jgi:CPA1 family monovalent cation:H+ antiporter
VNGFDIAAVLIAIAAVCGYVNRRVLRLPATSGTLVVALASSLLVVAADAAVPALRLRDTVATFLSSVDFTDALLRGMLCFLLFAGALHLDLEGLLDNKWTISMLATAGVVLSTALVGLLAWWAFQRAGIDIAFDLCLVFGALISPTDPIAVMGMLKQLRGPREIESLIAGESLFNDGIAVVVFFALASLAGLITGDATDLAAGWMGLVVFFVREVGGGVAVGLAFGYVAYRALMSIDDHPLELLITVALAMFVYALSFTLQVSGPIAVVLAGLLIGNPGRRLAMSARTREHVDAFWTMVDEIFNAVLFLMLGLEVFAVAARPALLATALFAIPIALLARGRFRGDTAGGGVRPPRPEPRDDSDRDVERTARRPVCGDDAVAAAVSGARSAAGGDICRRRVLDCGAGPDRQASARALPNGYLITPRRTA